MAQNIFKKQMVSYVKPRKVWPLYRGKRAGRLVKLREATRCQRINIVQPREINRVKANLIVRTHNPTNCIRINCSPISETLGNGKETSGKSFVRNILLSNVMSLAPKIDELRHYVEYSNLDLVCLNETWLRECITNNIVDICGYNLLRRDRIVRQHGGACVHIYIRDSIQYSLLDELMDASFEVLWIKVRPSCLPRGFSSIIVGTVYHPPGSDNSAMLNYLMNSLSSIESQYPQ